MLIWALIFLVISLIAAAFGYGRVSSLSAKIAKVIFFIFIVLFVISALFYLLALM